MRTLRTSALLVLASLTAAGLLACNPSGNPGAGGNPNASPNSGGSPASPGMPAGGEKRNSSRPTGS